MVRILVTGSRDWGNPFTVSRALEANLARLLSNNLVPNTEIVIVHGNARGADTWAKLWAITYGYTHEPYPADWDKLGKAAGVLRNQEMVDKGADIVLAFPKGKSVGTRDCITRADRAEIPVRIYEGADYDIPDG